MIIVARRKENHFAALTPKPARAHGASGRQPLNADDGADGPLPAIPGLRDIRASCASAGPRAEKEALLPSVASPVVNPGAIAASPIGSRRGPRAKDGAIAASLSRLLHARDHQPRGALLQIEAHLVAGGDAFQHCLVLDAEGHGHRRPAERRNGLVTDLDLALFRFDLLHHAGRGHGRRLRAVRRGLTDSRHTHTDDSKQTQPKHVLHDCVPLVVALLKPARAYLAFTRMRPFMPAS